MDATGLVLHRSLVAGARSSYSLQDRRDRAFRVRRLVLEGSFDEYGGLDTSDAVDVPRRSACRLLATCAGDADGPAAAVVTDRSGIAGRPHAISDQQPD